MFFDAEAMWKICFVWKTVTESWKVLLSHNAFVHTTKHWAKSE